MTPRDSRSSGLAAWLLARLASSDAADAILGDIDEDLERRIASGRGPRFPALWRSSQAWQAAGGAARLVTLRLARSWRYVARDARRAIRSAPGSTAFMMLILAVGIGAATVTFSVVDAVVLRSLPFDRDDQLVVVASRGGAIASVPEYLAWRDRVDAFASLAAVGGGGVQALTFESGVENVTSFVTTASLFDVLRVRPIIGRAFTAAEEVAGRANVAVISYGLWQRQFGGDAGVIGRTYRPPDRPRGQGPSDPVEIIGVMPPGFTYPVGVEPAPQVWRPFVVPADERSIEGSGISRYLQVVGRLKDTSRVDTAQGQLDVIGAEFAAARPDAFKDASPVVTTLSDKLIGDVRGPMLLALAAVTLVMLVACVNVANIMLARASQRARELAIRSSLGASRRQLGAALLVESLMLSLGAAALGVLAASWGVGAAKAALPDGIARADQIALDLRVLTAAAAAAIAAGLFFGIVPAWHAARGPIGLLLKLGAPTVIPGRHRWRSAFLVAQVASVSILLVISTMFVSSFVRVTTADLGFVRSDLVTFSVSAGPGGTAPLVDALRGVPGVASVAEFSGGAPPLVMAAFGGGSAQDRLRAIGIDDAPEVSPELRRVSPEYFGAAGIRVLAGRGLEPADEFDKVVVLDQLAASGLFPAGQDPIGAVVGAGGNQSPMTVVGVVQTVSWDGPERPTGPQAYMPIPSVGGARPQFLVRTSGRAALVVPALQATVARLLPADATQPVIRPLEDAFRAITAGRRFNATLMSAFSVLALLIGAAGVYAVMAAVVAQRRREMGVRVALGATSGQILRGVLSHAGRYLLAGLAIGLVAGRWLSELFASLLFEVRPTDGYIYLIVGTLLLGVGLAAALVPARRASRVDPMVTLKSE